MDRHYCPCCMTPAEPGEPCPACGLTEGSYTPAPHHLPPGTVLRERYLVGRVLGEGGFGITYIGCDLRLELKVAIKEYFPTDRANRVAAASPEVSSYAGAARDRYAAGKARFLREARTMAKMDKVPVIVSVRDFFEEHNTAYIVMEYIEGTTFKELVEQKGGRIPAGELLYTIEPLFSALTAMHSRGLIHRDISPENLMLERGEVRLLDFGCARESAEGEATMTIALKHGYAPVEQYQEKGQGPWTDVYALAATLYYCLTGKKPPQAMDRLLGDDVLVPPRKLGAELTERQEQALLHAMGVRPPQRFGSVEEFHAALYEGVEMEAPPETSKPAEAPQEAQEVPVTSAVPVREEPVGEVEAAPPPAGHGSIPAILQKWWPAALCAVGAVALAVLLFVQPWSKKDGPPEPDPAPAAQTEPPVSPSDGQDEAPDAPEDIQEPENQTEPDEQTEPDDQTEPEPASDPEGEAAPAGQTEPEAPPKPPETQSPEQTPAPEPEPAPATVSIGGEEFPADLEGLDLTGRGISDLSALSAMTELRFLNLESNRISDISALSALKKLEELHLRDNQVRDLTPLQGLTSLKSLHIGDNEISDISALSGLTNLEDLHMDNNQVKDLSPLKGLSKLETLEARSNPISDASPLGGLTSLSYVAIDQANISDVSPFGGLTGLTQLHLDDNPVSDISSLKNLTNLVELTLINDQVGDISAVSGMKKLSYLGLGSNPFTDLTPIMGLTQLKRLDVGGKAYDQGQKDSLTAALTECEIIW